MSSGQKLRLSCFRQVRDLTPVAGRHLFHWEGRPLKVESAETVAARIRRALPFVAAENIPVATDCGMKYLP